jgi:RNA polymerase sigma-70 factor (ECF subfamily)
VPNDDAALLERAVGGDAAALRELLERYGGQARQRVEGRIEPRWRSVLDAEDVMQIAYLEAFLHIDQLTARDVGTFVAWLARIAENALRDAVRGLSSRKRPHPDRRVGATATASAQDLLLERLGVTTTTPSREAVRHDAAAALNAAIERLPPDYRDVVRLYDLEGRAIGEVATAMRRSLGAVHMLRARAHDRLRHELSSAWGFLSGTA